MSRFNSPDYWWWKAVTFCERYGAKSSSLAIKKEIHKMANKTFSIRNHGLSEGNIYTLRYNLPDVNVPAGKIDCSADLINLSLEEMIALRETLDDNIKSRDEDKVKGFINELKRIAKRYNANGRIDASKIYSDYDEDIENPTHLTVDGKTITELSFNVYGAVANYTEEKRISI